MLNNINIRQIIIGGHPRSGTSMMKAIIGSHSSVAAYIWEFPFWSDYHPRFKGKKLSKKKITQLALEILESDPLKKSDVPIPPLELLKYFNQPRSYEVEEIYVSFAKVYLHGRGKNILSIKNPYIEHFADEIFQNFPNSKFVYLLRNPLDNFVSLQKAGEKWWNLHFDELHHIYNWKKSYNKSKLNQLKYNDKYHVIKYEDIILEPKKSLHELCDFLEIEFEEEMLLMKGQPGWTGSNSSVHSSINSMTLYTKSIDTYKSFLPKTTVDVYLQLLQKELKECSYMQCDRIQNYNTSLQARFYILCLVWDIQGHFKYLLKRTKIYELYKYIWIKLK